MPLIIICGHPSSGKTYRAKQIIKYLEEKISESSLGEENNKTLDQNGGHDAPTSAVKELSQLNLNGATSALDNSPSSYTDTHPQNGAITHSTSSPPPTQKTTPVRRTAHSQPTRTHKTRPKIHYISDHTLSIPRSAYAAARTEKDARATLYSAVKRHLSRADVVVLDSGNYIKGWRYQLHTEAKNAATPSCVVHVGVPPSVCREINSSRLRGGDGNENDGTSVAVGGAREADAYDAHVLDELLARFEEPNAMARWDSPLFTVPWDDAAPPSARIWDEVVAAAGGAGGAGKAVRPNQAAVLTPAASPSHLYTLDRTTHAVLAAIQAHQRANPDGAGAAIPLPAALASADAPPPLVPLPPRALSTPHLQRLRRQFVALHRQQMGGLGMGGVGGGVEAGGALTEARVAALFVAFLGERFDEL